MNMNDWDRMFKVEVDGKKYVYLMERDIEPENIKNFHYLAEEIGQDIKGEMQYEQRHIDWTPYGQPSKKDVELFIRLGCPSRIVNNNHNWGHSDLILEAQAQGVEV